MDSETLKQQLKELHETLEDASHLSTSERDVLGHLMEEMVEIASSGSVEEQDAEGIVDQLEKQATDFETRHPRLAGVLRQIMDALERMGI